MVKCMQVDDQLVVKSVSENSEPHRRLSSYFRISVSQIDAS